MSNNSSAEALDFGWNDNSTCRSARRVFEIKKPVALLLILSAVFLSYAPAVKNDFVWDDTALVLRDPLIRSWRLIPEGFNHFLFTDATASDFYRPIQRLTYTFEYALFAFRPAAYHLTSIACHAAAAVALFLLAQELLLVFGMERGKRGLVALVATLIWAIHPVHSAAVAYISGRADPLAAGFGFLGLYLILRSTRATSGNGLWFLAGATIAFLLSALSKENGLIFPLLGITFFTLRKNWVHVLKNAGVALFVATVYLSLRLPAEHVSPENVISPPPAMVRPILIARAVAEYAGLTALPINLHMDREIETQSRGLDDASLRTAALRELQTLSGIVLIGGLLYWMIRAGRRNPEVFACLLMATISYLPISGIATLNASVAEHWVYLPTAFLLLAGVIQLWAIFQKKRSTLRLAASAMLAVWVIFLGGRTFVRAFDWRDQRTFLERNIVSGGDSARMRINLGLLEMKAGKFDHAAAHLQAALQKRPDHPLAVINLAALALKQNDFTRARELLNRATAMPLVAAQAHEFLAVLAYKEKGDVDLLRLRLASRTGPPNWSIERRYIEMLDAVGATPRAISELAHCLRTEWYRAESWQFLGQLLSKAGRAHDAGRAREQAEAYDVHLDADRSKL